MFWVSPVPNLAKAEWKRRVLERFSISFCLYILEVPNSLFIQLMLTKMGSQKIQYLLLSVYFSSSQLSPYTTNVDYFVIKKNKKWKLYFYALNVLGFFFS